MRRNRVRSPGVSPSAKTPLRRVASGGGTGTWDVGGLAVGLTDTASDLSTYVGWRLPPGRR